MDSDPPPPKKVLSFASQRLLQNDIFPALFLQHKKRSSPKHIWMITYGAACPSVTQEMMNSNGLEIDECYTITWRESKYTLFHLPHAHRVRETSISKAMQRLKDSHGINLGEIFGYDAITSNTTEEESVESHVGFKRIIEVANSQPETMEWWMQNGSDLISNKKGLLWKYIHAIPPTEMSKAQLIKRLQNHEQLLREIQKLKQENATLLEIAASETRSANEMLLEVMRLRTELSELKSNLRCYRVITSLNLKQAGVPPRSEPDFRPTRLSEQDSRHPGVRPPTLTPRGRSPAPLRA